jgi:hypothetical protein
MDTVDPHDAAKETTEIRTGGVGHCHIRGTRIFVRGRRSGRAEPDLMGGQSMGLWILLRCSLLRWIHSVMALDVSQRQRQLSVQWRAGS